MDVADLIKSWNETIINLKSCIHFKRRQVASYNKIKDGLSYGEIIMHVDCSESYKSAQQDEIQSAYFGHTCFSIFTACCYYRSGLSYGLENVPVEIASDSSDHSRIAALSCVNTLAKHIQAKLKPGKLKVFIWSYWCAPQFRSKFVFMILTYFDKVTDVEWHYNKSHNGKGFMDGVGGGAVKNLVFRKVKSGHIVIDSPKAFLDHASQLVPLIMSLYFPVEEIIEDPEEIARVLAISSTLKIIRKYNSRTICYLRFFNLSDQSIPTFKHFYRKDDDPAICDHIDVDVDNNTCAYCLQPYGEFETQEWLECPGCCKWFVESCLPCLK